MSERYFLLKHHNQDILYLYKVTSLTVFFCKTIFFYEDNIKQFPGILLTISMLDNEDYKHLEIPEYIFNKLTTRTKFSKENKIEFIDDHVISKEWRIDSGRCLKYGFDD